MDIPLCLSPIEATDTGFNENVLESVQGDMGNHTPKPTNGLARQKRPKSMSMPVITDSDVNLEVKKTIVEWRGTQARRNTEEEKRQTWRRSLNRPIQKFFWTDIVPMEENKDRNMSVDSTIEEDAICDDAESDECTFISRDENGHPVFSPALHSTRQAENQEAVEVNRVNSKEDTTVDELDSKGGNETIDAENMIKQGNLGERIHALSVQEF